LYWPGTGHFQHWHLVVHWSGGIRKISPAAFAVRCAAVHGEAAARLAEFDLCRSARFQSRADEADECVLQFSAVFPRLGLAQRGIVNTFQPFEAQFRTAVGVAGIDGEPRGWNTVLFFHPRRHGQAEIARHADEIHGDEGEF